MAASIERIQQDMAALDQTIAALSETLYQAYVSYLSVLGRALKQQLILASYHVCTQGYPEAFLNLAIEERQQLQQALRRLTYQTQEELLAQIYRPVSIAATTSHLLTHSSDLHPEWDHAPQPAPESDTSASTLKPEDLIQWVRSLEESIAEALRTVSHAANRLLQQAAVLPQRLPEPLLQVAHQAELSESMSNPPNLLNVLIEANPEDVEAAETGEDISGGAALVHVVAIHLRLSEIEFADPATMVARNQVRPLLAELKKLGRHYHQKQRELAIAQAQAAWRSIWSED